MYLPLAAVIVAVAIAAYVVAQKLLTIGISDAHLRRTTGVIASVVVVCGVVYTLGSMTYARNRDYWSDEQIWKDTIEKRPDNPRARVSYAVDLQAAGRLSDAEHELREAVRLKETSAAAHANLGPVLCARGELDECIVHLERALALDPDYSSAHANLGEAYAARGKRALAARQFARAVEISPDRPFLLNRLAWLLATSPEDNVRDGRRAVELAEQAVSLTQRQDVMSLETLSAAYAEVGRFEDAVATGRQALALSERQRDDVTARNLAGRISLFTAGQKFRDAQ
jgi:tetratricopeptide (TPR) repeat protein